MGSFLTPHGKQEKSTDYMHTHMMTFVDLVLRSRDVDRLQRYLYLMEELSHTKR